MFRIFGRTFDKPEDADDIGVMVAQNVDTTQIVHWETVVADAVAYRLLSEMNADPATNFGLIGRTVKARVDEVVTKKLADMDIDDIVSRAVAKSLGAISIDAICQIVDPIINTALAETVQA